jgi:uroporphyrinogen-III decarboxylase
MGIKGLFFRFSLPLLIRLNTMRVKKGSTFFTPRLKKDVAFDPGDPKTWWMVYAAQKHHWIPVMAQMYDHSMFLAGVPAKKFYSNAKAHINTMSAVAAYYGFDAVSGGGDTYNYEAEAMGQRMIYSENAMPTVDFRTPLIKEPKDLKKIKIPDWLNAGRIPYILEVIKLSRMMGFKTGKFCAPFSLAIALRTYPNLIRDMKKDPEFVHDLFTFLVDEVLPSYLKVQKSYCGVSMATGPDAWAVFPNLSIELTEKWVVPYAERLFKNCINFGMMTVIAGGGDYCEERIEKFDKNILFKCFDIQKKFLFGMPMLVLGMGRWHEYPLEPVLEYLAPYKEKGIRVSIVANVNARLMRDGPVNKIVDSIRRFIDIFGRDYNLAITLANIPADTPPHHIHAAVASTHTYGRLPLAQNLNKVEFQIPKRGSFQDYIEQMSSGSRLSIQ